MSNNLKHERLPSGKVIIRRFTDEGALVEERHCHGSNEIGISYEYTDGVVASETYYAKGRMVSRRTYEKARSGYPDMPAANPSKEDWGGGLMQELRKEQRQRKEDAARRLAESAESRYPRPPHINWLRVIAGDQAHLVVFESRDWKFLARESTMPTVREWLDAFGFVSRGSVTQGLEIGFEVTGDVESMLSASRRLLPEIERFMLNPPEVSRWAGSVRPRRKPRRLPPPAWVKVLPPLIEFLSALRETKVIIFNHHQ